MKLKLPAGLILTLICSNTSALTYSEWLDSSDQWKRGYIFAYADYVTTIVASNNPESIPRLQGYRSCLKDFSEMALVKVVDEYLVRTPSDKTSDMIVVVHKAIQELCKNQLPPPPKSKR